jgi:hypothetical protein
MTLDTKGIVMTLEEYLKTAALVGQLEYIESKVGLSRQDTRFLEKSKKKLKSAKRLFELLTPEGWVRQYRKAVTHANEALIRLRREGVAGDRADDYFLRDITFYMDRIHIAALPHKRFSARISFVGGKDPSLFFLRQPEQAIDLYKWMRVTEDTDKDHVKFVLGEEGTSDYREFHRHSEGRVSVHTEHGLRCILEPEEVEMLGFYIMAWAQSWELVEKLL